LDANKGDFRISKIGISKIGDIFTCGETTSEAIGKRRVRVDSPHRIGLETTLFGIVIVVVGCKQGGFQNLKIGISKIADIFTCGEATSKAIGKRRLRLNSAHRLGIETALFGILIVVVGCKQGAEF
jgi:hypothetical protein